MPEMAPRQAEGVLNCSECKIYVGDQVCPTVALNSIGQLIKHGYKRTEGQDLTITWVRTQVDDEVVRPVLAEACVDRKNYDNTVNNGFPTVTY